jgi:hypothetical protein
MTVIIKKNDPLWGRDLDELIEEASNSKLTSYERERYADAILLAGSKQIVEETGKERGIKGEDPILFETHLRSRRRREIYTSTGQPDPGIVQGSFNRTHPQGRKVNSEKARKENGAAFYR